MGCAGGAGLGTRVLESLGSGNTSGVAPPSPAPNTAVPGPTARVASAGFLSARRDGDCTASLCQCLAALSVRRLFLISSLNLPWHNWRPCPLVLSLVAGTRGRPEAVHSLLSGGVESV